MTKSQTSFPSTSNKNVSLVEIDNKYKKEIEEIKNPSNLKRYLVFGGLVVGIGTIGILFASQIIHGTIALATAGIVGIAGYYGIKYLKNMDPYIQKKMANHKIKKLIEMAQKEKIETLENYALNIKQKLEYINELRKKIKSKILKYQTKISKAQADNNQELVKLYNDLLNKLLQAQQSIETIYQKSIEYDKKLQNELKILKEKQEFINETKEIINFLEDETGRYMDELLAQTASNEIENEFNDILSSLENISQDIEKDNG